MKNSKISGFDIGEENSFILDININDSELNLIGDAFIGLLWSVAETRANS